MTYEIINGTNEEENIINEIVKYIQDDFSDKLDVHMLHKVEIVDELENGSGGRAIRDKIILPRKDALEKI